MLASAHIIECPYNHIFTLNFLHINETINLIEEPDTSHSLRSIDAECDQADLSRPFWLDQVVVYPTTSKPSG